MIQVIGNGFSFGFQEFRTYPTRMAHMQCMLLWLTRMCGCLDPTKTINRAESCIIFHSPSKSPSKSASKHGTRGISLTPWSENLNMTYCRCDQFPFPQGPCWMMLTSIIYIYMKISWYYTYMYIYLHTWLLLISLTCPHRVLSTFAIVCSCY